MPATIRPALAITAKALYARHIDLPTACRMLAFAVLAKTETAKQPRLMHLRMMRSAWRKSVKARGIQPWAVVNGRQSIRLPMLSACK